MGKEQTYQGSSHCGAIQFEINAHIDHLRQCDCSVCTKRGALIFRVEKHQFRLLSAPETMSVYQWLTRTAKDFFCPTCGILPFRKPSALTAEEVANGMVPFTGWAINARCLDGFDISSVPIKQIKGSNLSPL